MKKVIIFDLDDTLINTQRIRSYVVRLAQSLGVSKLEALNARKQVRSASVPFTIERYAAFLFSLDTSKQRILIKKFYKMFGKPGFFNYPGVEAFLLKLSRKYQLIILTYGNKSLQEKKISQSGLKKYFSKIIISTDNTKIAPLKFLHKKYNHNMLFVDNAKIICEAASKLCIPTIWVTSKQKNPEFFSRLAFRINKRLKF